MVAFKGPNVILGLDKCNCSLTRGRELGTAAKTRSRELGTAAGKKQGAGLGPEGLVSAPVL